ncbi:MAG TPA: ZPR1 zinc finger domain-containing protein [Thermoplasmata archaeon]|nr:ZPR1 zinc finger domain-containing protein [Thermoplasmata archaeon]
MPDAWTADSPVHEVALASACPMCGSHPLTMRSFRLDIPFFGDALQTTILCGPCGFRHADVIHTAQGSPTRHQLRVQRPDDLNARIVRSSSCTVRIPEIGGLMEPGPRSDAFISNAEGVLRRFRDILGFMSRNEETKARQAKARASLKAIDEMIDGQRPFTIVLEDPFGNSAILHEDVEDRPLTEDEIRNLKTGMFVLELPRGTQDHASP